MFYKKFLFLFALLMTVCSFAHAADLVEKTKMTNQIGERPIHYCNKPWLTPYYQQEGNKIIGNLIKKSVISTTFPPG